MDDSTATAGATYFSALFRCVAPRSATIRAKKIHSISLSSRHEPHNPTTS